MKPNESQTALEGSTSGPSRLPACPRCGQPTGRWGPEHRICPGRSCGWFVSTIVIAEATDELGHVRIEWQVVP